MVLSVVAPEPQSLKPQKPKRYNILHKNKILSGIGTL